MRNALVQRERGRRRRRGDRVLGQPRHRRAVGRDTAASAPARLLAVRRTRWPALITAVTAGTIVLHALTYVPDSLMQRRLDVRQRLIVPPVDLAGLRGARGPVGVQRVRRVGAGHRQLRAAPGVDPGQLVAGRLAAAAGPVLLGGSGGSWAASRSRWCWGRWWTGAGSWWRPRWSGGELSPAALGHYRYGRRLATLPGTAIIEVFSYVLFPAFSRIAATPRGSGPRSCARWPDLVRRLPAGRPDDRHRGAARVLLLGEQWRGAGVALVAMAGFGPGVAMSAVGTEAIKGFGRSRLLNWLTLTSVVAGVGLLVAAAAARAARCRAGGLDRLAAGRVPLPAAGPPRGRRVAARPAGPCCHRCWRPGWRWGRSAR